MNSRTLLLALYAGFIAYSVLALFFGETGVAAMEKLNDRQRAISANLEDLDSRGTELKAVLSTLRTDPEAIVVEARSLGLYRDNDKIAIFSGVHTRKPRYDAGSVLRLDPIRSNGDGLLRIIALSIAILGILVSLLSWRYRDADSKRN